MAIRSVKNQYRGINAHLHSTWQAVGGWSEFHTGYIMNLFYALKPLLLPMGYTIAVESSLQIRRVDLPDQPEYRESDLTIYDVDSMRPLRSVISRSAGSLNELVLPISEVLLAPPQSEKEYNALKVYDVRSSHGIPLIWFELLSPANKPGGRDARDYFDKRAKIIEAGIVFVEIDYLHESPPTIRSLPRYRASDQQHDLEPHPYYILIVDPRPKPMQGIVRVIGFDVDQPIPSATIALNTEHTLTINFDKPYHKTLEDALYGLELVNYAEFPQRFDRYRAADQGRIAARMLAVLEAARDGGDLENAPLPVKELALLEALQKIETLKKLL